VILILEIAPPLAAKLGPASRQTFRAEGGTIGRANDNDWVLPHAKVSGRHAVITYRDGVFYIEDRSRNGVCINSLTNRVPLGRPHPIKTGDRLLIDPYEIEVVVTNEPQDEGRWPAPVAPPNLGFGRANAFEPDDPFEQPRFPSSGLNFSPAMPEPADDSQGGQELDPLKLLGGGESSPRRGPVRGAQTAEDLERSSPLDGHFTPPAVQSRPAVAPAPGAHLIPVDYDPLAPDVPSGILAQPVWEPPPFDVPAPRVPPEPEPAPLPPPPRPRPRAGGRTPFIPAPPVAPPEPPPGEPDAGDESDSDSSYLQAVLAGAGLGKRDVTPELARNFGQILRVVVEGVMDVLRSRQQIKDEFRMQMTHFRTADNNPLKFSANVEDALHNLLVKRNAAYLGPVEAFEDAFVDLRNHQIAMLAGMRVAFEFMLSEFDPDHLQEQFDREIKKGSKGSLLPVPAKRRYWELYRDRREEMVKDPEETFRSLFGEEFAKAYEEQLRVLKGRGHTGKT
jgi:type VI secretion system FHA domain protein